MNSLPVILENAFGPPNKPKSPHVIHFFPTPQSIPQKFGWHPPQIDGGSRNPVYPRKSIKIWVFKREAQNFFRFCPLYNIIELISDLK